MENSLGRCQTRAATMIYQKENDDKYQTKRKIADEIMAKILELQLPFKLDWEGLLLDHSNLVIFDGTCLLGHFC